MVLVLLVVGLGLMGYAINQYQQNNKHKSLVKWKLADGFNYEMIHYESTTSGWFNEGTRLTIYALNDNDYVEFQASLEDKEYKSIISWDQFKKGIQQEMDFFNNNAKEQYHLSEELLQDDQKLWWYFTYEQDKLYGLYDKGKQELIVVEGIY